MKQTAAIIGLALLCLLAAGCSTSPMTYAEWKKEQAERGRYAAAGVPFKSRSELHDEAAEMRRTGEQTVFPHGGK